MKMGHHRSLHDYMMEDCGLTMVWEELDDLKMLVEDLDIASYCGDYEDWINDIARQIQSLEIALLDAMRNNSHLEKLIRQRVNSEVKNDD